MSRDSSLNSSRLSYNFSKDWDTNLHQYWQDRIEAMLIEESKITEKPPRFAAIEPKRSDSFANPHFDLKLQDSGRQRSKASYTSSRSKRRTNVSSVSPSRTRTLGFTLKPSETGRLSDLGDVPQERRRRRGHREKHSDDAGQIKHSEVYQVRAYSKLLADLGT